MSRPPVSAPRQTLSLRLPCLIALLMPLLAEPSAAGGASVYYVRDGEVHSFDGKRDAIEALSTRVKAATLDPLQAEKDALLARFHKDAEQVVATRRCATAATTTLLVLGKEPLPDPNDSISEGPPPPRNLWLLTLSGALTVVSDNVYQAELSCDGSLIAYTTTSDSIVICDLNGQTLYKIEDANYPCWREKTSDLVYVKSMDGISLAHIANNEMNLTQLTKHGDVPSMHPSGDWFIFGTSGYAPFGEVRDQTAGGFWRYSFRDKSVLQITNGSYSYPIYWSHDGMRLVYPSGRADSAKPLDSPISTVAYCKMRPDGVAILGLIERDGSFIGWLGNGYTFACIDRNGLPQAVNLEGALENSLKNTNK